MSYRYPYGNTEQMNLDWFLNQWEKFKADWAEAEAGIDGSLDAEIAKVEAAMSELYAARDAAAASATAARKSSLDAAAAQVAAGNSKTAAQAAETSARGSQQAAEQSAQEAQASAQGAENSALTASQAANTATQQAAGADAAKGAAEAAQQAAEDAQAAAAQSAGQAGQAATAAGDHADDAADSATLAQQAAQDMSDSVAQITTNKNDISDLKESIMQLTPEVEATFEQKTITNVPIASFDDGADNVPVKKLVVGIEPVQSGSGDPSPDNVRPITGWTGAKISATGKNIFDAESFASANKVSYQSDGSVYVDDCNKVYMKTAWENNGYTGQIAITYTYKNARPDTVAGCHPRIVYTDGTYSSLSNLTVSTVYKTLTIVSTPSKIVSKVVFTYSTNNATTFYMQIEFGDTASKYEPFGTNYPVTFPVEAGTVYGGTLDLTNGILTIDHVAVDLSTLPWKSTQYSFDNYQAYVCHVNNLDGVPHSVIGDIIAEKYKTEKTALVITTPYLIGVADNSTPNTIWISTDAGTTPSGKAVYKLKTPITYTFTPIEITTILGINNIWADCGDIDELTYRAMNNTDAKIALTQAIIAPVLDSMVADTALVANDFRIVDNTLYHITTFVASGATLTPNTNCTATTIAEILKSLLT